MASSRVSTSRPRDAIGALCHLMNHGGITGLSPEIFRQAKFNKVEAVTPLWSLLSTLVHLSIHKCVPSTSKSSQLLHREGVSVGSLKLAMWSRGYHSWRFHSLPDDMSSGSRELLLACGWLLAKADILTTLMMVNGMQADTVTFLHQDEVLQERKPCLAVGSEAIPGIAVRDRHLSYRAQYLAWLVGKCQMAQRRLHMQQQELCNLTHQIHVVTLGVSMSVDSPHLTSLETYILRHAGQLKKYQQMLEAEQDKLHTCLKWHEHQATFWQWMESVLDASLQDNSDEPHHVSSDCNFPNPELMKDVLAHPLSELEGFTQQLEQLVRDTCKHADSNQEDNQGINFKQVSITNDVQARLVPPRTACSSRGALYQTPRFHLVKKEQKPTINIPTNHGKPSDDVHTIQEEIARLEVVVSGLQSELEELRGGHCSRMNDLTSVLPDAVCIPPMGSVR